MLVIIMVVFCNEYLSILLQWAQHHNHSTTSLYYHPPEVSTGILHGVLGDDKCFLVFVALKVNII